MPDTEQTLARSDSARTRFLAFARDRDERALEILLNDHAGRAYAQAARLLGNTSDAEDAIQEALLQLVRTADRYDGSVPFAAWLGRLTHDAAVAIHRSRQRRARRESVAVNEGGTDTEKIREADHADLVRRHVAELPEQYRQLIDLHYFGGLSLEDTACALGLSASAAEKRLSRARERLRDRLRKRGIVVSSSILLTALATSPAHAMPPTLAATALHAAFLPSTAVSLSIPAISAVSLVMLGSVATWIVRSHDFGIPAAPVAAMFSEHGPALPMSKVDTTFASPTGSTIPVTGGGDLQAALNSAQPGDTIVLQAGATFTGNYILTDKNGSGWIYVRSSAYSSLPQPETRVAESDARFMPKIVSPNNNAAFKTVDGAHHFRLVGLDISVVSGVPEINNLISFGAEQTTLAQTPHDLIVDRCFLHGHATGNVQRGILLNSARTAVIDSYISEVHAVGYDTQALGGWNGPGPFTICNNYLSCAGDTIFFGGSNPSIPNLISSDIDIRRNALVKSLSWKIGDPSYAGTPWTIEGFMMLCNVQRVLIEGNTFTNLWTGGAIGLIPRNVNGKAPWSTVRDVCVRDNIISDVETGIVLQANDNEQPSAVQARVAIVNNLGLNIQRTFLRVDGGSLSSDGTLGVFDDLAIAHNTALPLGYTPFEVQSSKSPLLRRFVLRDNVLGFGSYGPVFAQSSDESNQLCDGSDILRNALIGNPATESGDGHGAERNQQTHYDANRFTTWSSFSAAGVAESSGMLKSGPLTAAATDRTDLGVDFIALKKATSGCSTGIWSTQQRP